PREEDVGGGVRRRGGGERPEPRRRLGRPPLGEEARGGLDDEVRDVGGRGTRCGHGGGRGAGVKAAIPTTPPIAPRGAQAPRTAPLALRHAGRGATAS